MKFMLKKLFTKNRKSSENLNSGINSLKLSDPDGNILRGEFSGRNDLSTVIINEQASKIEAHAFECCRSLKDVIIEGSIESIGDNAFF